MADKRISVLNDATTLKGPEVLPLVQDNGNVKVTTETIINFHDRGEWDASGNLFPTQRGNGDTGLVKKNDEWIIVGSGVLGASPVEEELKLNLRALYDNPQQDESKWKIY